MKKYIAPEIEKVNFDAEDVVMTSGLLTNLVPKSLSNVSQESVDVIQKTFSEIFND